MTLEIATPADADALVTLRQSVNRHLESQYGPGYWTAALTVKGALFMMRMSTVFIAREADGRVIATLGLSTRKPWAIDKKFFSAATKRPLYLSAMAVSPESQRTGLGRMCIEEARHIASQWPADAIRLDAYDAPAGAGEFYRKCGFREAGRAFYRGVPLIYFEMLL